MMKKTTTKRSGFRVGVHYRPTQLQPSLALFGNFRRKTPLISLNLRQSVCFNMKLPTMRTCQALIFNSAVGNRFRDRDETRLGKHQGRLYNWVNSTGFSQVGHSFDNTTEICFKDMLREAPEAL